MAVWSGDTVRMDAEGYLYFIGRSDDMIKVSGYRISPTEVEEVVLHASGLVAEVAAFGVPHPQLGQAIVLLARAESEGRLDRRGAAGRMPAPPAGLHGPGPHRPARGPSRATRTARSTARCCSTPFNPV
jgi:hypothetical protein